MHYFIHVYENAPTIIYILIYIYPAYRWSFGIVLWEIATFGELMCTPVHYACRVLFILLLNSLSSPSLYVGGHPYHSIGIRPLLPRLVKGYRMGKPSNCSNEVYVCVHTHTHTYTNTNIQSHTIHAYTHTHTHTCTHTHTHTHTHARTHAHTHTLATHK